MRLFFLRLLTIFFLVLPSAASAQLTNVFVTNMPSVSSSSSSMFEAFEKRYHLDKESLQNQGENFNVSSQKGQAPQVLLYFSPSDPKPGTSVEARAFPEFFDGSKETLYYTWFIRRKGCDLDNEPNREKRERCDRNDDDKITVEDWKIEAMQLIAAGNFDATCSLDGNLSDEERENCARNMYRSSAPSRISPTGTKGGDRDEDGYRATFGGDSKSDKNYYCYVHDFVDGHNYEINSGETSYCEHLFPQMYRITDNGEVREAGPIGDNDDGPSKFPIEEERFWRTDPENPSTARNGNKDEANLAGLGQDVFRWSYAPEDMVGVIVEGTSMYTTKYDDSSKMIMWALPKNNCQIPEEMKGSKTVTVKGYDVSIKTVRGKTNGFSLNDCLEKNLVDPTEGGQAENLEVSLSATPEEPSAKLIPWAESGASASSLAQTGDLVTARASSSNARRGSSFTNYVWRVQASKDGTFNTRFNEENVWVDITRDLQTARNIGLAQGNGLTDLAINLNLNESDFRDPKTGTIIPGFGEYFRDDIAYLRITVNATESFNGKASQSGTASLVVKVVANKSIDVSDVDAVVNASTGLVSVRRNGTSFCAENMFQQTICPVLNQQIVGVSLDDAGSDMRDFSWTLNGEALVCTSQVSGECVDGKQGPVNFFPVSGKVGDVYIVSASASNAQTGKSFTVSRRFQIVEPDFDIISEDDEIAWPKYLGKYVNLDGSEVTDLSKTSFDGIPGGEAKLSALFRPETLGSFIVNGIKNGDTQNEMIWSINGKPFKWNDSGLSLALNGIPGDIYTVTLSGSYNQPRELRKALFDIWRISPFSSETTRFSKEIQVRLVDGNNYLGKEKTNTFFASLISSVPPFVLFSVRLFLSLGMILLITGVAFSFSLGEIFEGSKNKYQV